MVVIACYERRWHSVVTVMFKFGTFLLETDDTNGTATGHTTVHNRKASEDREIPLLSTQRDAESCTLVIQIPDLGIAACPRQTTLT